MGVVITHKTEVRRAPRSSLMRERNAIELRQDDNESGLGSSDVCPPIACECAIFSGVTMATIHDNREPWGHPYCCIEFHMPRAAILSP